MQNFLNALASGILFFLLVDVLSGSIEKVNEAPPRINGPSHPIGPFIADLSALLGGLAVGLLALVVFERRFLRGEQGSAPSGMKLGYMIATGIGLHNFSEGLAIGQSAAGGAVKLAVLLIIGFGLHTMTEGFGISAPLAGSAPWAFIGLAGLIGGGPTFLGTLIGVVFSSTFVFIRFPALAGGAIIYVLSQLLPMLRRAPAMEFVMSGLVVGFAVAYLTDLVLIGAGA